ncbi:hypothetical protein JW777_06315 [bacterium]|nr:hypothetical protein [bacterium]
MGVFDEAASCASQAEPVEHKVLEAASRVFLEKAQLRLSVLVPASDGPARLRVALSGFDDIQAHLRKLRVKSNPDLTFPYRKVHALNLAVEHQEGGLYQDLSSFAGPALENKMTLKFLIRRTLKKLRVRKVLVAPLPLAQGIGVVGLSGDTLFREMLPDMKTFCAGLAECLGRSHRSRTEAQIKARQDP